MSDADDLVSLMHRRAELLDSTEAEDQRPELESVTAALRAGLASKEARIRSLTLDSDLELLARLGAVEAVHPLDDPGNPDELADRVAPDRRCFVLEHDGLRGHPLNVVWVALTVDTPRSIDSVLGPRRNVFQAELCDTAVFYSIWSVERGLSGIPGGRTLLSLAMERLRSELPALETFVTLSPIPGFRSWTTATGAVTDTDGDPHPDDLLRSCAKYLTEMDSPGRPSDPVARFHMRNGARLWRINWGGDRSSRGMDRSWGLMANYRYEPEDREANRSSLAESKPVLGDEVAVLLEEIRS